jgi:hypothetical protein
MLPNAFTKKLFTKSESEETDFQMPYGLTSSAVIAKTQHSKQESPRSTPPNTELHSTITAAAAASAATTTTTTTTTITCYKLAEPCNAQKRFCSFFFLGTSLKMLYTKSPSQRLITKKQSKRPHFHKLTSFNSLVSKTQHKIRKFPITQTTQYSHFYYYSSSPPPPPTTTSSFAS